MTELRRWRGERDVPLNANGRRQVAELTERIKAAGGLDIVHHDWLSRDVDTAFHLANSLLTSRGPRPWKMGRKFEGNPITRESIRHAQWLVENPRVRPDGGETFWGWRRHWTHFLASLKPDRKIGVVTHNRNIQLLYSMRCGRFDPKKYNCDGPPFCSVHVYDGHSICAWDGSPLTPGIYLIRHGETEWGT